MAESKISVGIDVGTECIKVAVINDQGVLLGSSIVARRGYFQDRVSEAFPIALEDAQVDAEDLLGICATGFAENCVPMATPFLGDSACHALGAFHHHKQAMCVIDIGGRDPKAIQVDDRGRPTGIQTLRRCAAGIGTFLIFAARQAQETLRSADFIARVGGDEFIVLLTDTASDERLHTLIDRLRSSMCSPFDYENKSISLQISVGWATFPDEGGDLDQLIKNADAKMYQQKRTGKTEPDRPADNDLKGLYPHPD